MSGIDLSTNKTFCPVPFYATATYFDGKPRACCRFEETLGPQSGDIRKSWAAPALKELREKLLRGEQVAGCITCYQEEKLGMQSMRQRHLAAIPEHELQWTIEREARKPFPSMVDIRLSNKCNLKCRMCSPAFSHSIASEFEALKGTPYDVSFRKDDSVQRFGGKDNTWQDEFCQQIIDNAGSLDHLYISGGEPFLDARILRVLDALYESGHAPSIQVDLHTNGTIWTPRIAQVCSSFKRMNLMISIDGEGRVNDYQRSGSRWADVQRNFQAIKSAPKNVAVTILKTVTIYNALYFPEFIEWIDDELNQPPLDRFILSLNFLTSPPEMQMNLMPQAYREQLTKTMMHMYENGVLARETLKGSATILDFVHELNRAPSPNRAERLRALLRYTGNIDHVRGERMGDFIPKTAQMFDQLKEELNRFDNASEAKGSSYTELQGG
jgi:sulfatase maturation enzyme AslB (radical SAM superfamily)